MYSLSKILHRDFSIHLFGNPIPDYFDLRLKESCAEVLKSCFIDQLEQLGRCSPSEALFTKLSTLRIPPSLKSFPLLYQACEEEFKTLFTHLIAVSREQTQDPLHLWIGRKEIPPAYIHNQFVETDTISPDFIKVLVSELTYHNRVSFLHFHGEFGGIQTLEPLLQCLQVNSSVSFIQFSPNDLEKDKVHILLPRFIRSAPNLKQLLITAQQNSIPPAIEETFWPEMTTTILQHPKLESIICRNMGAIPPSFQRQIQNSGKYLSFA